ncbi:putative photosynthetic complex assembly protein PuhE [Roseivivax isoporae]|uniref:Photosynthetic complex assembly protein 2 n=1 Tax=Roseivivax isoporae LMG 25204 TaxID=1449351 RepID=X7FA41_9RHOB|nr:putative photosynthetic complex assembly protein PuhE [Roseivivax isoporae]ETX29670.1 hypothetical protein RISW2_22565 [Roseivivax isoporae LMG 25204]
MLNDPWIAALFALFAWWFSTGAILLVVRRADRRGNGERVTLAALPLLALGIWGIWATLGRADAAGAYLAFVSALAVWGWIELAFLTGTVTGPNAHFCPRHLPEWERFIRAWGVLAYHEMLLVASLLALWALTRDAANAFGFWTFAVLFFARVSAKLNLFLGVPRINTEFMPAALAHVPSHFRRAGVNWLFPLSVTALSFATACWLDRLVTAETSVATAGFALLAAMTALALLEHWFMVLPLPDEKLWRWMLPARPQKTPSREDAHGL